MTWSDVVDPDHWFRCCCNQRLIELLSSIADADADAVAADRSTAVVAAVVVVVVVASAT